ncbi:PREDICTED: uncharacterized protein LOC108765189, partial [Trachymyrmex cornetzi]|uniref:uncharacterized protein LOC108765189 n=1 Tax=Trachymyrmex cornetzi TaxID=471704 RepID=UPI00084EF709
PLWNSSLPYENRGPATIKFLWSEIDEKLNLYPGTASSKWRNLRDTYVRKLSEQNKYVPSGSAAEAKPKSVSWPYFELMGFLRSTVTRRKTFSNIKPLIPSTNGIKNKDYCVNVKEPLKDQNSTCVTPSNYRSNTYKKDTFLEKKNSATSSSTTSDTEILEFFPKSFDSQNQAYSRSTVPNYSLKRQNMELEEGIIPSKNVQGLGTSNIDKRNINIPEKRRRQSINKKENEIPLLEQSLISEIKKTDESMNKMISDPITAFCNYLATQLRTLSQHNFTTCQRRILSLLFELQDNYTQ